MYGLKGAGSTFSSAFKKMMIDLVFTPCRADVDVWMKVDVDTSYLVATTNDALPAGERFY